MSRGWAALPKAKAERSGNAGCEEIVCAPRGGLVLYRAFPESTQDSQDILPAYQLFFIFLIKFLGENVFLKSLSCNVFINSK